MLFELTHRNQSVHYVSGKTDDGLGDDQADFPCERIGIYLIKTFTFPGVCARDPGFM